MLTVLHKNVVALDDSRWAIGDWLVEGEKQFGEKAYEEAEQITGWERGSLYNVVWVVKRFREPSLRSETSLKWSHFKELARIQDENGREELLRQFNDGFAHSVINVRSRVDEVVKKLRERKGPEKEKTQKSFVYLQVSLKPDDRDQVKRLAKAANLDSDVFLRNIVEEYLERRKKKARIPKTRRSKNPPRSKKPVSS